MALVPYDPFHHLDNVRREFDRFFTNEFPAFKSGPGQRFGHLSVDVYETDSEVVAACDIPGLEKQEDVHIDVDGNMLTISGKMNRTHEVREEQMHRRERFSGRFQRAIGLPARVSSDGITASYRNGVLVIRMPKSQGDTRKRIDVQFH